MTKDDIIKLARETRVYTDNWRYGMRDEQAALEAFANLVANHEREECAQIVDDFGDEWMCDAHMLSKNIRARGNT